MLFQVLPLTESGRSTPASQASVATVQDLPMAQAEVIVSSANVVVVTSPHTSGTANLVETPLIEVSEEEDDQNKSNNNSSSSRHSSTSTINGGSERASSVSKDIKESQNYDLKHKQTKINNKRRSSTNNNNNKSNTESKGSSSPSVLKSPPPLIVTSATPPSPSVSSTLPPPPPILKETASVGIQVNLIQAAALPTPNPTSSQQPQQQPQHQQVEQQQQQQLDQQPLQVPATTTTCFQPSPSLARKLAHLAQEPEEMNLERHLLRNNKSNYESKTLPRRKSSNDVSRLMKQSSMEEKPAPLRRGYTHDQMLGLEQKTNPAWRQEFNKIRSQKPFKISELIGKFDKGPPSPGIGLSQNNNNSEVDAATSASELAELKKKRRGSLQIQFDPGYDTLGQIAKAAEDLEKRKEAMLKAQRRKSTPTLLGSAGSSSSGSTSSSNNNLETMKIQNQIVDILKTASEEVVEPAEAAAAMAAVLASHAENMNAEMQGDEKKDDEPEGATKKTQLSTSTTSLVVNRKPAQLAQQQQQQEQSQQSRQKNWDYFEIDHPKAISDKKLQQLKAKFSRRRTCEGSLNAPTDKSVTSIKEENEQDLLSPESETAQAVKPMLSDRSKSVPVSLGQQQQSLSVNNSLELSVDPLTGVYLSGGQSANTISTTTSDVDSLMDVDSEDSGPASISGRPLRKISTDSGEESATDCSSRRSSRSSIQQRRRSSHLSDIYEKPQSSNSSGIGATDSSEPGTILEVMIDPLTGKINTVEEKKRRRLSVEILPENGATIPRLVTTHQCGPTGSAEDDPGFISLPQTPTDLGMLLDPKLKVAGTSSLSSTASTCNSASTSQLADDGIFTSSEETLTTSSGLMKKATSLEACDSSLRHDESSMSRPASAASNTFVKAMEKFSVVPNSLASNQRKMSTASDPSSSSSTSDPLSATPTTTTTTTSTTLPSRRQSSPMIRPSSS